MKDILPFINMLKKINSRLILRVTAGLFFLIPGLFKIFSPGDFQEFLGFFPSYFEAVSLVLFWLVAILQIVGGLALLIGKQFRLFVLPLAVVSIVALLTTVPHDTGSAIQYLSFLAHIMTFGIFMGLFLIGPQDKDMTEWLHAKDPARGWDLVRISLAWFWLGLGLAIWFAPQLMAQIPATLPIDLGFWFYALIGLIAIKLGFFLLVRFFQDKAAQLSVIGFTLLLVFVALPDMTESKIGLINLLFMVLGIGSSLALTIKACSKQ